MSWRVKAGAALLSLALGCATTPLPPLQMGADWKIQQGQAVWKPQPGEGIAGELLVATNSAGDFLVEFAKPPITIATARRTGDRWQVDFPAERKAFGGRGAGPARLIWLHLAPALAGRANAWPISTNNNGWKIQRRDESLEGFLAP